MSDPTIGQGESELGADVPSSQVADRFRAAWVGDSDPDTAVPELLPVRLTKACTAALAVDGAGLSMFSDEFRVPIGASDSDATSAERLQFTIGEGPCLQALLSRTVITATAAEAERRWPQFYSELVARGPYRSVLSVPLELSAQLRGALDLYCVDPRSAAGLDQDDVRAVAGQIVEALTSVGSLRVWPGEPPAAAPAWLQSGAARTRMLVWVAVGILMARFGIQAGDGLALLRAHAYADGAMLDETSQALISGALNPESLRP